MHTYKQVCTEDRQVFPPLSYKFIPQSIKGGDSGEDDDDDVGSRLFEKFMLLLVVVFFFTLLFFKMQQKKVFQHLIRVPSPDCKVCGEGFESRFTSCS